MEFFPFLIDGNRPRRYIGRAFRPRQIYDQHFGLGLTPQVIAVPQQIPQTTQYYYRPWRNVEAASKDVGSTIKEDKDNFQVNLDTQPFAPEEISVKTANGYLVVEGKHEEKQDEHGFISRSFVRRYPLPEGIEEDSVMSRMSSDGVLSITAPLKPKLKAVKERVVPIVHTGPVKEQQPSEQMEEDKQLSIRKEEEEEYKQEG